MISSHQRRGIKSIFKVLAWLCFLSYCTVLYKKMSAHDREKPQQQLTISTNSSEHININAINQGDNTDDKKAPIISGKCTPHKGGNLLKEENGICVKGNLGISKDFMRTEFPKFLAVYDQRPYAANNRGTGIHHQFALWCIIRYLNPKHIIESGVRHGYGTWLMRQAAPNAQMTMIDPEDKLLEYRDKKSDSVYLMGNNFKDFMDISWETELSNMDRQSTVIFIDDHKDDPERIIRSYDVGFQYLVFDDNCGPHAFQNFQIPTDHFSVKMACYSYINSKPRKQISSVTLSRIFHDLIDVYLEFPAICRTVNNRENFLFPVDDLEKLLVSYNLTHLPPIRNQKYNNIGFIKLYQKSKNVVCE